MCLPIFSLSQSPSLRIGDFWLSGGVSVVMARRGWVQIGTSGIQIAVGWRGAVGARGWPWFCSPSSRSPSLRIGDFWLSGGVLVVVACRDWVEISTSGIQIAVG